MPNPENLIGHEFTSDQSREEAAKNGRKGGIASGEARRRRKAMREAFDELLTRSYTTRDGQEVDGVTAMAMRVFQAAMDGNLRAFEIVRDTVGEKPADKVEVQPISEETRAEMDALFGLA